MNPGILIESEGWSDSELEEIEQVFESFTVTKRKLAQFDDGVSVAIIIVMSVFGGAILTGVGNAIGKDVWDKLKSRLVSRSKNNNSTIGFLLKNNVQQIQLNIDSKDSSSVEQALSSIDDSLNQITPDGKIVSLYFDAHTKTWIKCTPKKFMKKFSHAVANTDVVEQGGKCFRFTKESLEKNIESYVGLPVTLGHGGKQIGEVTKAWMHGEVLMHEFGIYEDTSDEDLAELERMMSSGGGLSIGVSFDPDSQ